MSTSTTYAETVIFTPRARGDSVLVPKRSSLTCTHHTKQLYAYLKPFRRYSVTKMCGFSQQKMVAMATSLEGSYKITSDRLSTAKVLSNLQIL